MEVFFYLFAFFFVLAKPTVVLPVRNHSTLKLLHVFMRHGDRTPFHVYPLDPYNIEDFHPTPIGELTNAGKNRAYNVGIRLRMTYKNFLGDFYSPQVIKAITSPYSRCMDSVVLAVNAIFPPAGSQKWRYDAAWQPIHYEYNDVDDKLFLVYKHCPNFQKFQDEHTATQENRDAFEPLKDVLAYLRRKSGDYRTKYVFAYGIYSTLLSETELGLSVPDWAATIFPDTLQKIAKVEIDQMYRGKNKILGSGYFMKKVVNDTIQMLQKRREVADRKLYIYSGHDMNIASILSWLDVYEPHLPNYGAYIVFEIHIIHNIPYIKILHENYDKQTPKEIDIPGCGIMCPFYNFMRLYTSRLYPEKLCGLVEK